MGPTKCQQTVQTALTEKKNIPVRSEQLLASLQPKAGVLGADDSITKRDCVLSGDLSDDRLEVVVLDLSHTLPWRDCSESAFVLSKR